MTAFGLLGLGLNGMNAHAFGTQTASTNASNLGTEGYSRRIVDLRAIDGYQGSQAHGSRRVIDQFVERRILGANAVHGEASARAKMLGVFDLAFSDDAGNIGESLDQFNEAVSQLVSYPDDPASRSVFVVRAQQLARSFRATSEQLETARNDINADLQEQVRTLNQKLEEIGTLGKRIATAEFNGTEASDLRDRRDQLVREVAEIVPVKVVEEADGNVQVLLGGSKPLVNSVGDVTLLAATLDPGTGNIRVERTSAGVAEDMTALLTSGRIGGLIDARDNGLVNAQQQLDQLAFDFVTTYNGVHSAQFGLDGNTGYNLFEPLAAVAGAAAQMEVAANIVADPDTIAIALDPTMLPGDNRGALAMQALQDTDFALGGSATAGEAYGDIVGQAASALQDANSREGQAEDTVNQLTVMRESISGVSTDEEMVSLVKYQRGYQATLKVIQTADEMLLDLLGLKR